MGTVHNRNIIWIKIIIKIKTDNSEYLTPPSLRLIYSFLKSINSVETKYTIKIHFTIFTFQFIFTDGGFDNDLRANG